MTKTAQVIRMYEQSRQITRPYQPKMSKCKQKALFLLSTMTVLSMIPAFLAIAKAVL